MPLTFNGRSVKTEDYISLQAKDSGGTTVPVKVSLEAHQDFSLPDIYQVASDKFDQGEVEPDGSV